MKILIIGSKGQIGSFLESFLRSRGFEVIGIDLVKDPKTKERAYEKAERIMYRCMERGLAFKIIEGNVITLRPSLILTQDQCNFIIDTIEEALKEENR